MKKPFHDAIETKERILFAAKREFAEKGYSGARMGSIAKNAHANQALIHYYFNNKENLYIHVLHRLFGVNEDENINNRKKFFDYIDDLNLITSERLYVTIYLMVNINLEATDPDFNKIIGREIAEGHNHLRSIIQDYFIPRLSLLEDVINKGIEEGEFETRNTLFVVIGIISFVMSYESNREYYIGTQLYDRLYNENNRNDLCNFVIEHTFKALTPAGKVLKIPKISDNIISSLNEIINEIKIQQKWIQQ